MKITIFCVKHHPLCEYLVIGYTPTTLKGAMCLVFTSHLKMNNWLYCSGEWAQLSLELSPYPTKKETGKKKNHCIKATH
jgi:hypothetical protein